MIRFKYVEDIEEWLDPMGYSDFWVDVSDFEVHLPYKEYCDEKIGSGKVEKDVMLGGLKFLASTQIAGKFKLERRPLTMPDKTAFF